MDLRADLVRAGLVRVDLDPASKAVRLLLERQAELRSQAAADSTR